MATTVTTGKSATFTFDSVEASAQVTSFTPDETRSTETIETLGGTAVTGATRERTVAVEFLFDGNTATTGGFYGVCKSSFESDAAGTLSADIDGAAFTGQGICTALSTPVPADGAVTCTATFSLSSWAYTAPTTF